MRARTLELTLAAMGAGSSAALDLCNRELRRVQLLPVGGRGLNTPEIDQRGAAAMLIGLASSAVASQAGDTALTYAGFIDPLKRKDGTLLDFLTKILGDPALASEVDEIRVCRTRPWAMVVGRDGGKRTFHPAKPTFSGDPNKHNRLGGREEYVIGSVLLHQIAIDFKEEQG